MHPSSGPRRKKRLFSLGCGCRDSKSVSVSASISDTLQNSRNPKPNVPIDPLFSSETRSSSCEDKDNCSLYSASSSSFSGLLRQLSELEQSVLEHRSQIPADTPLHARSRSEGGRVGESVAVVKDSDDPLTDFRRSMLQMIVEKEIVGAEELKELLGRFLALNEKEHHEVIVRAFEEIWSELFSGYYDNAPEFLRQLKR
eukprot:TRINITY_DN1238_c0_g1_i2.p1 TRINITY_DN1238_c0_g1~~TRINITY_DN1238_c0_g1_i2.p1  ORF type:complete len:199 (+),score=25.98 TRINITY_DN1238_c0_g1_i2:111-707(+)